MKNIFIKLFCIFAFILCFASTAFASVLNINSAVYDDSASMLVINSTDNDEFNFSIKPKLIIMSEENKAYFDIANTHLKSAQDIVVNSPQINEIIIKQLSEPSDTVRVQISYNEEFNPKNIQLKKLDNTLFVRFKTTQSQNFYFQHIYTDVLSSVPKFYEPLTVQSPVVATQDLLSQINSAFKLGATTEDKNYILAKKDLILPTKYYLDNIVIKNATVQLFGIGSLTLTKPFGLSNPNRFVFDIPNAILNPVLRNKELNISDTLSVKAGQFDRETVRIVVTGVGAEKYFPVIAPDLQRIVFTNSAYKSVSQKASINSINSDIVDSKTHSIKLVFSNPVVYGFRREGKNFEVYFYNVDKFQESSLKSVFEGAKISALPNGGAKLSLPAQSEDIVNIHAGVDGKTLRIRVKSEKVDLPQPVVTPPVNVTEIIAKEKAKPVNTRKVVVIDPGHGGSDCGATRNKIFEKDITLDISKRVEKLLSKKGYDVYMTRYTDESVSLQERVEISENVMPDIFVSIHVNSSNSESPNGLETHYYKENSLMLAKTVHASMLNHINANNRGLFKSQFYVINHTTAPAILVEIGFISNPSERAQLVSDNRKQLTAKAIAEGIDEYLK